MANPIIETTRALVKRLDGEARAAAEDSVMAYSLETLGRELDLEASLNLIKAAKYLADADGLSAVELRGMKMMMTRYGLPQPVQWHILEFPVSGLEPAQLGELVEPGGTEARFLLSAIVGLAALDGLSDAEVRRAAEVGAALGLHEKMVDALVIEVEASLHANKRRDRIGAQFLREIRQALFELP